MTTTKTTDFCNANGIKWFPINLTIHAADENGKCKKDLNPIEHIVYSNSRPNIHDFTNTDLISARQHLFKTQPDLFTHLCIDTKDVFHIDIDTEDYEVEFDNVIYSAPWFKSMTKSYGKHILCKYPDFIPPNTRMQFKNYDIGGVELLCGGGSYAPYEMENTDKQFYDLNVNPFKIKLIEPEKKMKSISNSINAVNINTDKMLDFGGIIKMEYLNLYQDWLKIIWSLRSESEDYKEVAREISKSSKKYDDEGFDKAWEEYKSGSISIGTFYHYAKISNEAKFKEICAKYTPALDISLEELSDIFKCASKIAPSLKKILKLCNEAWWVLGDNQLWKPIKDPAYYIILEIRKYIDYSENKVSRMKMATEGEEAEKLHKIRVEYIKQYEKINTPSYISLCKSYLKVPLCDNDFEDKLNVNPNMLAFQNGMVDLKNGELRAGGIQWDDYLTDTIRYDYVAPNAKKTKELKGYLKQILNNDDSHLEYFLQILGFTFLGMPQLEKSLYFMIDGTEGGKGDNGKTFYFDILDTLMPHYVYKSKGTLLEDGNTKVHKQLCMTKGKRLVWTDEFSRTKKMNATLMKELADGKTIENEIMFGTSDKINILFKMFVLSNFMIKIDATEEAVYNRYKQASFCSNFDRTGTLKEAKPELLKFIADTTLGDRIKTEYRNEVFGLIIEYAKKYNGSIKIPTKFLGDAKEAKLKNDEFGLWFNDNLMYSKEGRISIQKIIELSHFKNDFIKEGMSRLGFKYDRGLRFGKDLNGNDNRGGFVGCSMLENEMISNNDTDNEGNE